MKHRNFLFLLAKAFVLIPSPSCCFIVHPPLTIQTKIQKSTRYSSISRFQATDEKSPQENVNPNGVKISTDKVRKPKKELTGIDIERADLRLQGLEVYALIGALQSSASIGLLTESGAINVKIGAGDDVPLGFIGLGLLVTTLAAAMGGLYVTMVFSMCSLYGKSAIGLYRDEEYDDFMEKTGGVRFRGFQAFTYSLTLFGVELVLLSASKLPPGVPRFVGIGLSTLIVLLGWKEMQFVIDAATPIFIPNAEDDDDVNETSE